jgi:A/G-specific adenine glycosylase
VIRITEKRLEKLLSVRVALLAWFKKNGRAFHWRTEDREPYHVLVSEFMLQQTQASRVMEYLPRFLKQFPSVSDLAKAKNSDVIRAWQGLGYNRRALNLQKAAQAIVEEHKGVFPINEKELLALPGVGLYTARAIQAFVYNKPVSVLDVNVERVISRITKPMRTTSEMLTREDVHSINERLMPKRNSCIWHEALMDLGATICTKKNPHCSECPLSSYCASAFKVTTSSVTVKANREPRYFGEPKRIWRGRILKLISSQSCISAGDITEKLRDSYKIMGSDLPKFVGGVLQELTKEGFSAKDKRGYFTLAE